jgi:hypothetical protein
MKKKTKKCRIIKIEPDVVVTPVPKEIQESMKRIAQDLCLEREKENSKQDRVWAKLANEFVGNENPTLNNNKISEAALAASREIMGPVMVASVKHNIRSEEIIEKNALVIEKHFRKLIK